MSPLSSQGNEFTQTVGISGSSKSEQAHCSMLQAQNYPIIKGNNRVLH